VKKRFDACACEQALRLDADQRRKILNEFGPQSEILVNIGRLFAAPGKLTAAEGAGAAIGVRIPVGTPLQANFGFSPGSGRKLSSRWRKGKRA
jgi:hypothetical protein